MCRVIARVHRLCVRLIKRSPSDRLDPKCPHAYALEVGYVEDTATLKLIRSGDQREKGLMVCVHFNRAPEFLGDRPGNGALDVVADLWARQMKHDATLRNTGKGEAEEVHFDIPSVRGTIHCKAADLADDLHRLAQAMRDQRDIRSVLRIHGPKPHVLPMRKRVAANAVARVVQ